jgi:hypothetical protein
VLFDEGAFGVQPLQDDEFAEVSGEFLGIVFRIFEAEVGCGFAWFDLGEGRQTEGEESEEGGAGKAEGFVHELTFSLRIQKSRWGRGERIELTPEMRMEERVEALSG